MLFYETLNKIIESHNSKSVDICQKTGIKKSYLSRIRNGTLIPPDFGIIDDIVKVLDVSDEEYSQLVNEFQKVKIAGKHHYAHIALEKLYSLDPFTVYENHSAKLDNSYKNGQFLNGNDDLKNAISHIIKSGVSEIKLLFCPSKNDDSSFIASQMNSLSGSAKCIIPLEQEIEGSKRNTEIFVNSLPIIFTERAAIRGLHLDLEKWSQASVFPYFIMNENELLMFDSEVENGFFIRDNNIVKLYHDRFNSCFADAFQFISIQKELSAFLESYESVMDFSQTANGTELYIIENYPCILFDIDIGNILEYVADFEKARIIAMNYLRFLQNGYNNVETTYSVFSKAGLEELINAVEYYEISPQFTKPLPIDFRRNALKKIVAYSGSEDNFLPMLTRSPFYDKTLVRTINIWSDGKMLVYYSSENGFCVMMINEKSIVSAFVDYYKALIKSGLIKCKNESLEDIKNALEKAEMPIED